MAHLFCFVASLVIVLTLGSAAEAACADPPQSQVKWSRCFATGRELAGLDLTGGDLREATLNNSNLEQTKLVHVDARRAKFIATRMKGAILDRGEFVEADFSRADLQGASLQQADLRRARFFRANLREANFTGARLDGVDLLHADLSGALWVDGKTRCAPDSIGTCHPD